MQVHRARQMNESHLKELVFPDIKQKYTHLALTHLFLYRTGKDYHKDNMEKLRQKEQELQNKMEEERNQPKKEQWKMKRFQSVDAKVSQYVINHFQVLIFQQMNQTNPNKNGSQTSQQQYNDQMISNVKQSGVSIQMETRPTKAQQMKANQQIYQNIQTSTEKENNNANQYSQQNTYDYNINYKEPKTAKGTKQPTATNIFQLMQQEGDFQPIVVTYDKDDKVIQQQYKKQNTQKPPKATGPPSHHGGGYSHKNEAYQQPDYNADQKKKIKTKEAVPKVNEINYVPKRQDVNFVSDNKNKVVNEMQPKQVKQDEMVEGNPQVHKNFGKIPKYINKYKNEKEEALERQRRDEEESKIPPGTRLMPEDERLKTLEDLQNSKKEVNNLLEKMPIANKSMAMEKRKKELEDKLLRIERAIDTFSKKVVYVAL